MQKCEKIPLKKNLRKSILRGHPWIYREAIDLRNSIKSSKLVKVTEGRQNSFLAWAIYDPNSVLALRILSTLQSPPNAEFIKNRIYKAIQLRKPLMNKNTNSLRLINGEGDGLPGLIVDKYNLTLVIQFDGEGMQNFWLQRPEVIKTLMQTLSPQAIVHKNRQIQGGHIETLYGEIEDTQTLIKENNLYFYADIEKGQKTGFFFDQRENRKYISHYSKDKSVLNLFSYTGGFSIYCGMGGANRVTSVDISQEALKLAHKSWVENQFPASVHHTLQEDIFSFLKDYKELWDVVIVDPPSLTHSEKTKLFAQNKYIETFSLAAKRVSPDGDFVVSSCSSHINFDEFYNILSESLSKARRQGQVLRISGQGPDHPFPHACPELRYLKFIHCKLV